MPVPVDPFDDFLRPPSDESPDQRTLRLAKEEEARQVSAAIDASIKAERNARRKKRIVRLLLLGQSESGKSTTLRQFQRLYTPTAFREERVLWRAVIQLNVVRSIRTILDAISLPTNAFTSPQTSPYSSPRSRARSLSRHPPLPELPGALDVMGNPLLDSPPVLPSPRHAPRVTGIDSDGDAESDVDYHHTSGTGTTSGSASASGSRSQHHPSSSTLAGNYNKHSHSHSYSIHHNGNSPPFPPQLYQHQHYYTQHHPNHIEALKSRLAPIRHVEQTLISKLVPPNEDEATHLGNGNIGGGFGIHYTASSTYGVSGKNGNGEVFVRPTSGWKGALARARVSYPSFLSEGQNSTTTGSASGNSSGSESGNGSALGSAEADGPDEVQETLSALCGDMIQLWQDAGVREVLKRRKIRLEEGSGFFLNDLPRVTSLKYLPSDDDVLKARLKTVGVAEYRFEMEVPMSRDTGTEWRIVDVGGSRSQRPMWAPFFDDVDAIIFLAPISGFDQVLSEDRTVNRLEDSVLLWKSVCSNKLLAGVDLVLFLNKCDILDAKLKSGTRLAKYVRSYGDRENDLDTVSKYMRGKFSAIHREHSPSPRKFYAFCTSVTDTTTTAGIIASVRDMVIRQHLKQSRLL